MLSFNVSLKAERTSLQ